MTTPITARLFYNPSRKSEQMNEVLTMAHIGAKFDSEWVLIEDPRTDEFLEVRSGTVRWHGKDREEVYRRAVEIRPQRFAIVYTGKMPGDTAIPLRPSHSIHSGLIVIRAELTGAER
jgi:hypothetical protein